MTKVKREKSHPATDYPKWKKPAIKGSGFSCQKATHRSKENAVAQLIRYQALVTAILREKCLYYVKVIRKKKFQAGYKLDRICCLDGKKYTFPSLIGSNGLLFYPGQRKTEVRISLSELATGGSVLGADSTNGSFSHKLCQDIPLTILEKVG